MFHVCFEMYPKKEKNACSKCWSEVGSWTFAELKVLKELQPKQYSSPKYEAWAYTQYILWMFQLIWGHLRQIAKRSCGNDTSFKANIEQYRFTKCIKQLATNSLEVSWNVRKTHEKKTFVSGSYHSREVSFIAWPAVAWSRTTLGSAPCFCSQEHYRKSSLRIVLPGMLASLGFGSWASLTLKFFRRLSSLKSLMIYGSSGFYLFLKIIWTCGITDHNGFGDGHEPGHWGSARREAWSREGRFSLRNWEPQWSRIRHFYSDGWLTVNWTFIFQSIFQFVGWFNLFKWLVWNHRSEWCVQQNSDGFKWHILLLSRIA